MRPLLEATQLVAAERWDRETIPERHFTNSFGDCGRTAFAHHLVGADGPAAAACVRKAESIR